MNGTLEVVHVPERKRYELRRGGETLGFADALPEGERVVIPYVEVRPELQGQGYGAILVRRVLDELRAAGKEVVPLCGFAASVMRAYPG